MSIRVFLLASRPKTLTAAVVPVLVGAALAYRTSPENFLWWISICSLIGALAIQIATNLFNDAIDFDKGADTAKRLGPTRVTQRGYLKPKTVKQAALVFLLVAGLCGIPLILRGGMPILLVGLVSVFLAYGYTGGPFPIAYRGFGDLFVLLFFGVIAVGGTYYLHELDWNIGALTAGLQVGFLSTVLIAINNLRDMDEDKAANKKTLAVRFGASFVMAEITALVLLPFLLGLNWWHLQSPESLLLPLLALPMAVSLLMKLFQEPFGAALNALLGRAALLHLVFGLLLAAAFVMHQ